LFVSPFGAQNNVALVRFEVFTAVTMKNTAFWDVKPRGSCKKRRFLQDPPSVTSQKTVFFKVALVFWPEITEDNLLDVFEDME
jgi:hypothetical protein